MNDYNAACDTAASRYEATKAEREKLSAGIRRWEFERFITETEKLHNTASPQSGNSSRIAGWFLIVRIRRDPCAQIISRFRIPDSPTKQAGHNPTYH